MKSILQLERQKNSHVQVVKKATDSIRASILSAVEKAGAAGQLTPSQAELPAFTVEIPARHIPR